MNTNLACVLLLFCSNRTQDAAYRDSLEVWNMSGSSLRRYAVDACGNITQPYKNIQTIPYRQEDKRTVNRRRISGLERGALLGSMKVLKEEKCEYIFKITGKYPVLKGLEKEVRDTPSTTHLALSSRGRSYGGWSSEIFGARRELLQNALLAWTDGRNTESFLWRLHHNYTFFKMKKNQ